MKLYPNNASDTLRPDKLGIHKINTVKDNLLWGTKIIVLKSLSIIMLDLLHYSNVDCAEMK